MRRQVLPLPTGTFIIVQCNARGDVAMIGGTPVALNRTDCGDHQGHYSWKSREYPATLFYTYRAAYECARQLDGARPVSGPSFYEQLSRPIDMSTWRPSR